MIRRPPRSKRPDTRFPYTTRFRSQCHERADINIQNVHGRGLEKDLELVIMLQAIRVLAVSSILGTTGWLHIGGAPRLGHDQAQNDRTSTRLNHIHYCATHIPYYSWKINTI